MLRIKFPDVFGEIVRMLESMNFWDHLFDAECEGVDNFNSSWIVKVIVLPGIPWASVCTLQLGGGVSVCLTSPVSLEWKR